MANETSENDQERDGSPDGDANQPAEEPLSRRFVIACWSFLLVPTALPLVFIPLVQNTDTMLMLGAMSALLLVSNGLVLVVMIRWVKKVRADA